MNYTALDTLKPNQCGKVKTICEGCGKAKKRLYELGLYKDATFKVVKNDFGPIILNLSGNKLALGRKLASKVIVEPYFFKSS